MADPFNQTAAILQSLPVLGPVVDTLRNLIAAIQFLVGGIFGLYLILVFLRWRESKMAAKVLKEIRDDIRELSKDIKIINERVSKVETQKRKRTKQTKKKATKKKK